MKEGVNPRGNSKTLEKSFIVVFNQAYDELFHRGTFFELPSLGFVAIKGIC